MKNLVYVVEVEAFGSPSGSIYFSNGLLPRMKKDIRPYLIDAPRLMSLEYESSPTPLGGIPQFGEIEFAVLDHQGEVRDLCRMGAIPSHYMATESTAADTTLQLESASGIIVNQMLWIGGEAVKVTDIASAPTLTVLRGQLNTTAERLYAESAVYTTNPKTTGRNVTVYRVNSHAEDLEVEDIVGLGAIDNIKPKAGEIYFACRSAMHYVQRLIGPDRAIMRVTQVFQRAIFWELQAGTLPIQDVSEMYVVVKGDEQRLLTLDVTGAGESTVLYGEPPQIGDTLIVVMAAQPNDSVFVDDDDIRRFHVVDIVRCILTSSYTLDDGLLENNGDFSRLAPGYGAGVPVALIDEDSFTEMVISNPSALVTSWYYGQEETTVGEVIDPLLRSIGVFLVMRGGLISLAQPRKHRQSLTVDLEINEDNVDDLTSISPEFWEPIDASFVSIKTADTKLELTMKPSRNPRRATGSGGADIQVVSSSPGGLSGWAYQQAIRRFLLIGSGAMSLRLTLHPGHDASVGDLVDVSLRGVTDLYAGTRQLDSVRCTVTGSEIQKDGTTTVDLVRFGSGATVAELLPAVKMVSAAGDVVTCESSGTWFEPGDVVKYIDRTLTTESSGTQIVLSSTTFTITLDGDFGGDLSTDATAQSILYVVTPIDRAAFTIEDGSVLGDPE